MYESRGDCQQNFEGSCRIARFLRTATLLCGARIVEKQIADQAKEHGIGEEEVVREIMLRPMPKKAFISMEELYATVAFLASDDARNMTGQAIAIDGGWTAR
jgi:NAD(P)-dependent dehydrogenase (short-subunit alcohol dehydrogenase family)